MKCPNCRLINPPTALRCDCGFEFLENWRKIDVNENLGIKNDLTPKTQALPSSRTLTTFEADSVLGRYRDGYRLARWMVRGGTIVGVLGMIAACFGGLLLAKVAPGVAIYLGGFSAFLVFLLGTAISGLGQLVMSSLDTAVNTSPFISDTNKARIMSLS